MLTVFLSKRLFHDPLENFLGRQRQRGGASENPSMAEFCTNTQAMRVVDTVCADVSRGNCRGNVEESQDVEKSQQPLPK